MQIFVPFADPLTTASCLDVKRRNKQIIEANIIIQRIAQKKGSWANHPVVKMYAGHIGWVQCYLSCLRHYASKDYKVAQYWATMANKSTPPFLTEEFCDQHKRRLYTKNPNLYPQFSVFGKSYENWYVVDGKTVRYLAGKIIKENGHD